MAVGWALLLTALMLGPLLYQPGHVLAYDQVGVPQQVLQPWMWGGGAAPPRAVPQDVYVALADDLVPGAVLQRLILAGALLAATLGVRQLLSRAGLAGQLASMGAYAWSAYVYERLVIGHWGLLLAVGALPWVVWLAARTRAASTRSGPALVLVVLAGTWVPTGGVILAAVAVAILLWPGAEASRAARVWPSLGVVAVQATWLAPALLSAAPGSASGGAFGLRADGLPAVVLSALGGSGIWSEAVAPPSHTGWFAVVAVLAVLVPAAAGVRRLPALVGGGVLTPLVVVAVAMLTWAVVTALPSFDGLVAAVERAPGGGLLRDAQKWLAPWWLLVALAFGAATDHLTRPAGARPGVAPAGWALVVVPLVVLPDLAWGAAGRIAPAQYPTDWAAVQEVLASSQDEDLVASLPWSTFRRFEWNHNRVSLDPAPRYLHRTVVADSELLIGRAGHEAVIAGDDPLADRVADALRSPDPVPALQVAGIGWVLVSTDQPAGPLGDVPILGAPGTHTAWSGQSLALVRLDGLVARSPVEPHRVAIGFAWLVVLGCALVAMVFLVRPRAGRSHAQAEP